jgi:hypothetical protein
VSDDEAPVGAAADPPAGGDDTRTAEAATRLLDKLRVFVTDQLDPDEQALLAVLLAPGVAMAYPDDEVVGFSVDWRANALPEALAVTLREGGLRVEGF